MRASIFRYLISRIQGERWRLDRYLKSAKIKNICVSCAMETMEREQIERAGVNTPGPVSLCVVQFAAAIVDTELKM